MEKLLFLIYDIWLKVDYLRQSLKYQTQAFGSNCWGIGFLFIYFIKKLTKDGKIRISDQERQIIYNAILYCYYANKKGILFEFCFKRFLHLEGYEGDFSEALTDLDACCRYYANRSKKATLKKQIIVYRKYPDELTNFVIKYQFIKMIGFVNYFIKGRRTRLFFS